ncbi:MAG: nuclease-related domain-containing protein [Syntrophobacteraceae bacterium]
MPTTFSVLQAAPNRKTAWNQDLITTFYIKFAYRPETQVLRAPGSSLLAQIDELSETIESCLFALPLIPLTSYSVYITHLYMGQLQANLYDTGFLGTVIVGISAFYLAKLVRAWKERRKLRLAHDGEVAVAQELTPLMLAGYYVFHDFEAEKFNIDHIAVGRAGVFAIETKARTKRLAGNGGKDAEVIYDGRSLRFPSHTETKPIEQTKIQASWLSKWISSAVGEPVKVTSILTLPGWYIKRVTPDGIPALNPRQIPFYISKRKEELPKEMITRIVHQLDQRCRDVEPKAFGQ